ncbi:unnamed protein product [Adineta steineri]|uniref:Uncharacterized protein n=1 Tax=Adineta steineri TaxID=433720 RepID=A0A814E7E7_9BILA|nr:unnamed protein product [Adineta steineri]
MTHSKLYPDQERLRALSTTSDQVDPANALQTPLSNTHEAAQPFNSRRRMSNFEKLARRYLFGFGDPSKISHD